jgi:hypothetical protein
MSVNPFAPPENYGGMVQKIAVCTFVVGIALTAYVRATVPAVEAVLGHYDFKLKALGSEIPIGYLVPALAFTAFSAMFKLHDRISDLLRIRVNFDVNHILLVMANAVGIRTTDEVRKRAKEKRGDLMGPVFYKYVSSTNPNPAVDRHLISGLLHQWQWYWVLIEGYVMVLLALIPMLYWQAFRPVAVLLWAVFITLPVIRFSYRKCAAFAKREIDQILADPTRLNEVRKTLSAL